MQVLMVSTEYHPMPGSVRCCTALKMIIAIFYTLILIITVYALEKIYGSMYFSGPSNLL